MTWLFVGALAAWAFAFKVLGVTLLPRVQLGPRLGTAVALLPAALLAALIAQQTFTDGGSLGVDSRAAGLLGAAAALRARLPFPAVLVVAAATTAILRRAGWS